MLLGRYPAAAASVSAQLPGQPAAVPAGLPSELLERRPDVIAAERRVAAAFNRVGEAKAARLPTIALTTGVSAISSELFVLQDHDNPVWNFGASLLAPIYRAARSGRRWKSGQSSRNRPSPPTRRSACAPSAKSKTRWRRRFAARDREQILAQTLADNQRALEIVQTQFKVGSTDLRFVTSGSSP